MFSITALFRYIGSCAAGQRSTGTPFPMAIEAKVVTGVSSIPRAIFEMVIGRAGRHE